MRLIARLAALAVLALLAVGCGDGNTDTVTGGGTQAEAGPLTKAEYIAQADAVCHEFRARTSGLGNDFNRAVKDSDYARAAGIEQEALEALRHGYERIAALPAPEGDAQAISEIANARNEYLALDERYVDALEAEDTARIEAVAGKLKSAADRRDAILSRYGFKVCGQS